MRKIKLLVVDDSLLFREVLSRYIRQDQEIDVVGTAGDPYNARDMILKFEPDVMTLDIEMPLWSAVVLGAVGAVLGEIGDLSFSVIKRQTGIKDYGHIFPGHGGVLDRFDSVLFVAPFAELLFRVIW